MHFLKTPSILLLVATFAQTASTHATTAAPQPKKEKSQASAAATTKPGASTTKTAASSSKEQLISDQWYTVTVGGTKKYAFYNERTEIKDSRIAFQTRMVKLEDGFLNEEQLGTFSENTPELKPLFYNFHSVYRSTEIKIDGNVSGSAGSTLLTVRIKKGNEELPVIKRSISSSTLFSSVFPLWLEKNLAMVKEKKSVSFTALLEDNLDIGFSPVPGRVNLKDPDEFAKKNSAILLEVVFKDTNFLWWLDLQGKMIRMESPSQKMVIERVSKKKAESFLEMPPQT